MGLKRAIILLIVIFSRSLWALDLEVTQGINSELPIAIATFGQSSTSVQLVNIIRHDLAFSGQFKLIESNISPLDEKLSIMSFRQAGADSLLTGSVRQIGVNRFDVTVKLLDMIANGRILLAKNFQVNERDIRALAHHISDLAYEKLTGERGIFSTRIAYILVKRQNDKVSYSLDVADVDGFNPQQLLISSEPIMSPTWSPDGRMIAYVSFEKKKAQIFTITVETGKRQLITNFSGINNAPAWSFDGRQLAVALSKNGHPKIYSVDMANGALKQLTFGDAIDTEPHFSPDGKWLLFTSGRGGAPQIYRLSLADGHIERLTYQGNYNAQASYTPDQKHIIMMHRDDNQFSIGVQDGDKGPISPLTDVASAESPTISPNGRLVLYATHYQDVGILGVVSLDGRVKVRLPSRDGDIKDPAWSPYLR